jgi:hypothetical protein
MTEDQAFDAIYLAILNCELVDARGDTYEAIREIKPAKALAKAVFDTLRTKGLLKLDED